MCGIIGYVGGRSAKEVVIEGLKRLEYRGYDSSGYALIGDGIEVVKAATRVGLLADTETNAHIGIGHTRWATHGAPSAQNAHPHLSYCGRFAVVHNGIIENEAELRAELAADGVAFKSETDSELIAHLIAKYYKGSVKVAILSAVERMKGAYTFLVATTLSDSLYAYRKNVSLTVGIGEGEYFVASDMVALAPYTKRALVLADDEMVQLNREEVKVYRCGRPVIKKEFAVPDDLSVPLFGESYMQKEIEQIPFALERTAKNLLAPEGMAKLPAELFEKIENVYICGCGTAYHAAQYGKYVLEKLCRMPVDVVVASEARSRQLFFGEKTLAIFISQSGETSDTLSALKIAREGGSKTLAITNVKGSSITFAADAVLYSSAGPEIAVAATKSYNCQLLVLYMLSAHIARLKSRISEDYHRVLLKELDGLIIDARRLTCDDDIVQYAKKYKHLNTFFIGRGTDCYTASEGALKLKEITYKLTEAYPAGELKHGAIALIDSNALVIAICTGRAESIKLTTSIKELKSRGAHVIAVSPFRLSEDGIVFKCNESELLAPLLSVIPLQKYALAVCNELGYNADKPRNLAKSVTVE